jgi:hypothetical protein
MPLSPGPPKAQALTLAKCRGAIVSGMPWVRKFDTPIALNDGRTLATLADAHRLVLSLPERRLRTDRWQYTRDLLLKAAGRDGAFALAQVCAQLPRALKAEGLI